MKQYFVKESLLYPFMERIISRIRAASSKSRRAAASFICFSKAASLEVLGLLRPWLALTLDGDAADFFEVLFLKREGCNGSIGRMPGVKPEELSLDPSLRSG